MKRRLAKPVAWLFGPELIASLKSVVLHTLYRGFDVRDWMRAEVFDATTLAPARSSGREDRVPHAAEPFWFDYLADTGDGWIETYSVAALCLGELHAAKVEPGAKVSFASAPGDVTLPRGDLLVVGGDTAYHVANRATLKARFQEPFTQAFEDLARNGRLAEPMVRPLLGIPGNHDYYDMLDGFNRQFRRPVRVQGDRKPELHVPAFRREQEASYAAIRLPHDWWLLALDTEKGRLDFRQHMFFQAILDGTHPAVVAAGHGAPKKLVVLTPSPTTVFGRRPLPDEELCRTFEELGLRRPFVAHAGAEEQMRAGECRLDLSGDTHHYARYWGSNGAGHGPTDPAYASVVSGLGGAFLHPTGTVHGPLAPRCLYPDVDASRREVGRRLLHPWTVMSGGYVGVLTGLITALFYVALAHRYSIRWIADRVLERFRLEVDEPEGDPFELAKPGMVVFLAIVLGGGLLYGAWRWSAAIYVRAKKEELVASPFSYAGPIALLIGACAVPCVAVWLVQGSAAGSVAFDILFYLSAVFLVPGVVWFAVRVGAKHQGRRAQLGFAAIGLWHLLMQILPVALLVKVGAPAAYVVTAIVWTTMWLFGRGIAIGSAARPAALLVAWIVLGVLLLVIPLVLHRHTITSPTDPFVKTGYVLLAGGIGFFCGCFHFAWYLAVCHGFHGHNNEIGGAARIGYFKELLRIRVEPDRLTVHTVAVDRPRHDAEHLEARLVDVFTVSPARPA